jgi:phage terminase large subunit
MNIQVDLRGAIGKLAQCIAKETIPPEVLIVGAAGTGKTWGVLLLLHLMCLERPNLRVLIARKTREAISESVLVTYEKEILPLTGHERMAYGIQRRVRQTYVYPNGTEWIVGGLDNPRKILSTSYDLVFVNEAIECDPEDWETLQSRIGRPGRSHGLNCLLGDTNPGDASHWLKMRCDKEKLLPIWNHTHKDNPSLWDNKKHKWTHAGELFLARLSRLTGARRKRLLEGLWVAGEGAWFDSFGDDHIHPAAEYNHVHPTYLAVDSGVHTGAVWFNVFDRQKNEPIIHVFGDYYSVNKTAFDSNLPHCRPRTWHKKAV